MDYCAIVQPLNQSQLSGVIHAPASKSAMQRACAAALVKKGRTIIHNPGHSNDDKAALDIIQKLGAVISPTEDGIMIESKGVKPIASVIHCGESGLSIRMFTPVAAISDQPLSIEGVGSLVMRPMHFFDEILPQLKVAIQSNQGKLPLQIQGPLQPQDITVDGSVSSQFLTGLLMAYAAVDAKAVTIEVKDLKSKPYIDLTLSLMQHFGLKIPVNTNYQSFYFENHTPIISKEAIHYTVEGDWSGGAFLLVAGAISGSITVTGLDLSSTQADKKIMEALIACGAALSVQSHQIEIGRAPLKAFHFDATDCPDLFPPLVALAAYCTGNTVIEGVNRLTHKESNRALTLQTEFQKMGVQIDLQQNLMIVKGGNGLRGANVHSHHDHRIAMACAVAALKANGPTSIAAAGAIDKSYTAFYNHLKSLGAAIQINGQ